jgi:small-conductance mechanosensitive channel
MMDFLNKIPLPLLIILSGIVGGLIIRFIIVLSIKLGLRGSDQADFINSLRKVKTASLSLVPILVIFLTFTFYDPDDSFGNWRQLFQILLIISATWFLIRVTRVFQDIILSKYDIGKDDNIQERKVVTQLTFMKKLIIVGLCIIGLSAILLSFEEGRKFGAGLITSAGILSIIVGLAAQKTISNLLAGIQIAFTQPIKIDDVVIVEKEWGRIEEINLTYVVVKIWDLRRLVVPITYFVEQPFQNWTRTEASLIGTVFIYTDFRLPLDPLRQQLAKYLKTDPLWDTETQVVQVTDTTESTMLVRALVSARNSSDAFDLRCNVREMLITFIKDNYPHYLPTTRVLMEPVDKKE